MPAWLIPLLVSLGTVGYEALSQVGKAGERGIAREQIKAQERIAKNKAEAEKATLIESRAASKKYMNKLMQEKAKERISNAEQMLMESFMASQDSQMALLLQAIQATAGNNPYGVTRPMNFAAGMTGLMRSNL